VHACQCMPSGMSGTLAPPFHSALSTQDLSIEPPSLFHPMMRLLLFARNHWVVLSLVSLTTFVSFASYSQRAVAGVVTVPDVILVLSGGVTERGTPHCTVSARLAAAVNVSRSHSVPVILNGGGTTFKPRYTDKNGFALPEAALLAAELERNGVERSRLFLEALSDDTIGNAFFARVMHTDLRPEWRNLLVITSDFQLARAAAIYSWAFGLSPQPSVRPYRLSFQGVPDTCMDPEALRVRTEKEADGLRKFMSGVAERIHTLRDAHEFVFQAHSAYSAKGALERQPLSPDSPLAKTY
jgi:uncharacterized SAM-binding protein YcdF (DUF218 family)